MRSAVRRSVRLLRPSSTAIGALIALALACVLVGVRYTPPAALPADADPAAFSAGRARAALQRVLSGRPHPTGSHENRRVRERIEAELGALDFAVEVQRATVCGSFGSCAAVENVLALHPGQRSDLLLLSVHYDSAPASPGAADDGSGVAALLEIARLLRRTPPTELSWLLLFDDGEEAGLLGMQAFLQQHPLAARVRRAVNLDARGTSGPSLMFETAGDAHTALAAFASGSRRPITNSLLAAAYAHLPNRTDFSAVAAHGVESGANFAFIGSPLLYHSARDDLAHLSLDTLQHQGENAWGTALALASADAPTEPRGEPVFFDVLAAAVVRVPEGVMWSAAALAVILLVATLGIQVRARRVRLRDVVTGMVALPALIAGAGAIAAALTAASRATGALPAVWVAHPEALLLALLLVPLALTAAVSAVIGGTALSHWYATWLLWAAAGVAAMAGVPGGSYLLVGPALVAALAATVGVGRLPQQALTFAVLAPFFIALLLWLPILRFSYEALGFSAPAITTAALALVTSSSLPVLGDCSQRARRRLAAVFAAAAAASAALAQLLPPFSEQAPRHLNLILQQAPGNDRWLVEAFGAGSNAPLSDVVEFRSVDASSVAPLPILAESIFAAPAPAASEPARLPVSVVRAEASAGIRNVEALIGPVPGAHALTVAVPEEVLALELGGVAAHPVVRGTWRLYRYWGTLDRVPIRLRIAGRRAVTLLITAEALGLPPAGSALMRARGPASVAFHGGDRRFLTRRWQL
ncbi:MAG TPA: M28 family peptidase [Polyangiaceae bacterium]|nr:M28 family peptidase [Polyangiaceae bacterium]